MGSMEGSKPDFGELLREDLRGEGGASNLAFNEKVKGLQAAGQRIFHFAFGQSPFPVPQPFIRHLQDTAGCNDYLPVAGLPDLRKAIVAFHAEWEGVTLNEGGLVVGPGSKELIYLTTRFCYVNFEGAACLQELASKGQDFCPGDDFVRQFCPDLVDGVASLVAWVSKLKCQHRSIVD